MAKTSKQPKLKVLPGELEGVEAKKGTTTKRYSVSDKGRIVSLKQARRWLCA